MKPKVTRVAGRTRYPHSHSGPDQALPLPNPPPPPSGGGPAGKGCAHSPHNSLSPERPGGLGGGVADGSVLLGPGPGSAAGARWLAGRWKALLVRPRDTETPGPVSVSV